MIIFTWADILPSTVLDQLLVKYWASMAGYLSMFLPVILNFGTSQKKTTLDLTREYATNGRYLANVADAVGQLVLLGNRISSLKVRHPKINNNVG